jgi:hypothetical protein
MPKTSSYDQCNVICTRSLPKFEERPLGGKKDIGKCSKFGDDLINLDRSSSPHRRRLRLRDTDQLGMASDSYQNEEVS